MPKIKIDKARCKACYLCIVNCPNGLIKVSAEMGAKGVKPASFSGGKPARLHGKLIRAGGCTGCTMCAVICPDGCIKVYR